MKKYIIGIFIGAFLATAGSVFADDVKTAVINMIGKTVQGSFPIEINGQKADKDAVVIDGTSYIPVRSAGLLFGYDVSFVDSHVILKAKDGVVNMDALNATQYTPIVDDKAAVKTQFDKDKADNLKQISDIEAKGKAETDAEAARQAIGLADLQAKKKAADENITTPSPSPSPTPTP